MGDHSRVGVGVRSSLRATRFVRSHHFPRSGVTKMNCRKRNCPYEFKHSHAVLANVMPSQPLGAMRMIEEAVAKSIGPIGQILYDPDDDHGNPGGGLLGVYLMTGPLDIVQTKYTISAGRSWMILEPGCAPRVDTHHYDKPVNRSRGKCTICHVTWNKCHGHGPESFIRACVFCGAKNRVSRDRIETARCGRCKKGGV